MSVAELGLQIQPLHKSDHDRFEQRNDLSFATSCLDFADGGSQAF
jgi:hypothetical protein